MCFLHALIVCRLPACIYWCSQLCRAGTLDPRKVNGKIVSCTRGGKIKSVAEGQEALSAGAKGMVLRNQPQHGTTLEAEPHVFSAVVVKGPHPNHTDNTPSAPERSYPDAAPTEFQIADT